MKDQGAVERENGEPGLFRLLVIAGLSPQVVTEALYLLTVLERRAVSEVKVFSTPEGKKAIENVLLLEADNPLDRLCRDYTLNRNRIRFGPADILPVWSGGPIEDAKYQTDAADRMMALLSGWTTESEPPMAACVAGGRKNMGILFVQVFSLLARPCDRLFHLVVTPEFENLPGFFYPPPNASLVESYKKGQGIAFLNSAEAKIIAVDIPMVRLRSVTDENTRKGLLGFSRSRDRVQQTVEITDTRLYLNLSELKIRYGGTVFELPPREFALFSFFCRVRKQGPTPFRETGVPSDQLDQPHLVAMLEDEYRQIKPQRLLADTQWVPRTATGDVNYPELRDKITHGVSKIKRRLGNAHPAKVNGRRRRGCTCYGVEIEGGDIIFESDRQP